MRRVQNSKQVQVLDKKEIKIFEPIMTYGSKFEIAQSLFVCKNVVRNYIRALGGVSVPFGIPGLPVQTGVSLVPPALAPDNCGIWGSDEARTRFLTGAQTVAPPGRNYVYDIESGAILPGVNFGTTTVTDWSFAFAPNIAEATTFVTGKDAQLKAKIRETAPGNGDITVGLYAPSFDPDSQANFEARPRILYYHLNRLWLAYRSIITRRSLIFFTDALDTETIRGVNFLDFPDLINVIFRASAGDLDPGATAHLLFGGEEKIFILDGDPTLGNATFRQLKKAFGISSSRHVTETSVGAAFFANDNRIYMVPAGAQEPIPIDETVRNSFDHNDPTLMIGFRFPYLYVFRLGEIFLGDMSNIQSGSVSWSGPHQAIDLPSQGVISDNPFQPNKTYVVQQSAGNTLVSIVNDSASQITEQKMESGYFSVPDSHVRFRRSFLTFQQDSTDLFFTFTLGDTLGRTDTVNFMVPAFDPGSTDQNFHVLITFPESLGGEGFFVRLECDFPNGRLENIREWFVEYRIDPRKH